ncbi:MAG: hydrogenase maturation nickel metallochaperone HypA [Selenomonas massiliensis]
MHEMAIAEGILDIALTHARDNDAQRIERIHLLLGELSGVETEALTLAFRALVRGTIAETAALTWTRVPLAGRCHDCGKERALRPQDYLCPDCGGGMEFTHGREMRVDYIEME